MSEDWKEYRLGDLIVVKHGFAFKGEFFSDEPARDILLTPGNFKIGGGFKINKLKYYKGSYPKEYILSEGDILITMTDLSKTGDTLGYSAKIPPHKNIRFLHNQRLGLVEFKSSEIDKDFLYWLLRTEQYHHYIVGSATGSTVKHTSPSRICEYEFRAPGDPNEQRRIAVVLSSLDEKIELNLQMNATLEQIAQAVFKRWFIDFQFPGFDEQLVDGLPKGWKKASINSIATKVQYGLTQSASNQDIGPKFLRITDIQNGTVDWEQVPRCIVSESEFNKYRIVDHDIFIARTGASTGENVHIIKAPKAVFASYLIRVQIENKALATYVGKFLRRQEYFNYISSILGGSAQPNANAKELTGIEIIVPTNDVLENYFQLVDTLNRRKNRNEKENQILSRMRDSLLPKLMSSKIRVAE